MIAVGRDPSKALVVSRFHFSGWAFPHLPSPFNARSAVLPQGADQYTPFFALRLASPSCRIINLNLCLRLLGILPATGTGMIRYPGQGAVRHFAFSHLPRPIVRKSAVALRDGAACIGASRKHKCDELARFLGCSGVGRSFMRIVIG